MTVRVVVGSYRIRLYERIQVRHCRIADYLLIAVVFLHQHEHMIGLRHLCLGMKREPQHQ